MLPRTRAKTACTAAWHGFDKTVFDMGFEGDDTLVLTAASPTAPTASPATPSWKCATAWQAPA